MSEALHEVCCPRCGRVIVKASVGSIVEGVCRSRDCKRAGMSTVRVTVAKR